MNKQQALQILKDHNEWRRDPHVPNSKEMQSPELIGIAIDFLVDCDCKDEPKERKSPKCYFDQLVEEGYQVEGFDAAAYNCIDVQSFGVFETPISEAYDSAKEALYQILKWIWEKDMVFRPDWDDTHQDKWYVDFNCNEKEIDSHPTYASLQSISGIYFEENIHSDFCIKECNEHWHTFFNYHRDYPIL